jgi:hypothetical protein
MCMKHLLKSEVEEPKNQARGRGVQNLGEAELLVSCYQYMRLRGYPADKISILTTYNGQKALLRDVIEQRCARHPAFGRPNKVCSTKRPRFPLSLGASVSETLVCQVFRCKDLWDEVS